MIYDITPLVTKDLPVWPGSKPLSRSLECDMKNGAPVTSSSLTATCHLGAHVDAPSHYSLKGETIETRSLDFFIGKCQVIRVDVPKKSYIHYSHLSGVHAPRVLFATGSFDYTRPSFQTDFSAIDPKLMEQLAELGVITVGIDTPSVDLYATTTLDSHQMALRYNLTLLEGIDLRGVPEGFYELIALPLKLKGFDASPVRAILRSI
ncbi:MAG: cyclase family protein [Verrucomicrobia bacterium]|nr:cyclase family protein [Verrucomicrobiota bacterium]